MNSDQMKEIVNTRQWPKPFALAQQAAGCVTPWDFIANSMAQEPKPLKPVSELSQAEMLAEFAEIGTPERIAKLSHHRRQEFATKVATQWKNKKMTQAARELGDWTLSELRGMK